MPLQSVGLKSKRRAVPAHRPPPRALKTDGPTVDQALAEEE